MSQGSWSRRGFIGGLASLGAGCAHLRALRGGGAISAGSPEATLAGARILRDGGNAIDAAVASAFALAVTEPAGSGLGGISLMTVGFPDGSATCIDAHAHAPRTLPTGLRAEDIRGHRAMILPTTVGVLGGAWARFGSKRSSWSQLLEPAIEWADRGVRYGPFRMGAQSLARAELAATPQTRSLVADAAGVLSPQPALADTLRRLAEAGYEDFYRGRIADSMVSDVERHGGWLGRADLEGFELRVRPALSQTYRDATVHSHPLPGSGWSVLQMLALLERAPSKELSLTHARRPWWMTLVLRRGHHRRVLANLGDDRDSARLSDELSPALLDQLYAPIAGLETGETSHLSVLDSKGMAVSLTSSLNTFFGSRVAAPELGFVYNDYLSKMRVDSNRLALTLRAGRQPPSSMSPTIVTRKGRPVLVLGSPGSERIISAIVQTLTAWLDGDVSLDEALEAPRVHFDTRRWHTYAETLAFRNAIRATGLKVSTPGQGQRKQGLDPYFGGVHAVALENERLVAAADPRRDGVGLVVTR